MISDKERRRIANELRDAARRLSNERSRIEIETLPVLRERA